MIKSDLIKAISEYPDDANIIALFNTDGKAIERVTKEQMFSTAPKTTISIIEVEDKVTDILIVSERE